MVAEDSIIELERGEVAPDFSLPGTDGRTYSLPDFDNYEAVLLVFTCNHCPYAKAKFEALNRIAEDYDQVAVVGINPNDAEEYPEDSFDRMKDLVEDGTIQYDAYLRDESQDVARDYGAICTPDPFLLESENGEFQLAYHGRLDDALDHEEEPSGEPGFEMRAAIDNLLAGDPIEDEFKPSRGCSIKWK